jgi:hypothetical protein
MRRVGPSEPPARQYADTQFFQPACPALHTREMPARGARERAPTPRARARLRRRPEVLLRRTRRPSAGRRPKVRRRAARPRKVLVLPRDPIASRLGRAGTPPGTSVVATRGRHSAVPRPTHFSKARSLGGESAKDRQPCPENVGLARRALPLLAGCPILPNRVRTGLGPCRILLPVAIQGQGSAPWAANESRDVPPSIGTKIDVDQELPDHHRQPHEQDC